jgi:multidrug resistance protein, MATE family
MHSSILALPHTQQGLTKYPQGSVRELWAISFPLMLSLMSSSLMFFWDRLLLAHYSLESLNAATNAGSMAAVLQFGCLCTVSIAEVFVGQYNGAGKKQKLGEPVWQMIWLSLLTILLFIPIGLFAGFFLFQDSRYAILEIEYFKWLMFFGPVFCLTGALSAFFIGKGSVKFVTLTVILANIFNTGLAFVLIFGYAPFVSPMGVVGAAIATGIAQGIQALVLFIAFIHPKNRALYGTGNFHFNGETFWKCVEVGFPSSLAHTIEIFAWACLFRMMTAVSHEYIAVVAIAQSIFYLFTFITEGISKGASAIAANLIGARRWDLVWKLLRSGIKFYVIAFVVLGWFLVLDPDSLVRWFIPEHVSASNPSIHRLVTSACLWVWIFFLFDGITWLVVGLLTAAGDTGFVLKAGGTTVWLFAILPIYILIVMYGNSPDLAWAVTAFYGFANCGIYLWRFKLGKWKEMTLVVS